MLRTLPVLALLASLALPPAFASAQDATAPARPSADAYTHTVQRGLEQLAGGNSSAAVAAFREAMALDGSRPHAQYYLAAALRMSGEVEGALEAFRQAAALAQAADEPRWRARALHAVAATLERMPGHMEQARAAWEEYVRFAEASPTIADAQLGRARIQAIDIVNEQEQAYVNVRQRIADREEERRRGAEQPRGRRAR